MRLFVGVDGGGTHTRAVVVDENQQELGRAMGPGAVVTPGAPDASVRAVADAVRAAVREAGGQLPVERLWAGLAGAGSDEGRLGVTRGLEGAALADQVVVGTDVEAAFHHTFGSHPGILLIAGTGSVAWGRSAAGDLVRVGGWGERLGDEGSGFAIGLAALRAILHASDGRGARTSLTASVVGTLGLERPEALVAWCAAATKGDVAALVPVVVEAAEGGDMAARAILDAAVEDLSAHVAAAVERTGPWEESPVLVLWGGLLQPGGPLRSALEAAAAEHSCELDSRTVDPALGAAWLALASPPDGR